MSDLPEGALLQKSSNGVSYVYLPSYYYDRNARTKNKEKQKRLYIGKFVDGKFVPNRKYLANPGLTRKDAGSVIREDIDLSQITTRTLGKTTLLLGVAAKSGLDRDLQTVYGEGIAGELLTLALFMAENSDSALSLCELWQRGNVCPTLTRLSSQYIGRLLARVGAEQALMQQFFSERIRHVKAHEYLSYDSTKIASESENIDDVRWAPSKSGNYRQEISLAILCGHRSRIPVMFRVIPGNVPDVKTLRDLLCRWEELGIDGEATAVLDRGYNSLENLGEMCRNSVRFIAGQKVSANLVKEAIDEHMPEFWGSRHYLGDHNLYAVTHDAKVSDSEGGAHSVHIHLFRSDANASLASAGLERRMKSYEKQWEEGTASKQSELYKLYRLTAAVPGDGSRLRRDFDAIDGRLRYQGFFAFVSNHVRTAGEALDIYRGRDCVEKTFKNLQTGLDLKSAGVHHNETLQGKLLVCMIALSMIAGLSYEMEKEKTISGKHYERLYKNYSLNELLGELANIRLIGMPGHEPRISEMTSKQKLIYARVGVPEPVVREDTV